MSVKAAVPFQLDECFRHRPTNRRIRCAPVHDCTLMESQLTQDINASNSPSSFKCNQREQFESKTDPITGKIELNVRPIGLKCCYNVI